MRRPACRNSSTGSGSSPRGDDERDDGLSSARVRLADHGHLRDRGMRCDRFLDLAGVDVEPGDDDDVLRSLDEAQPAVRIRDADVAGAQPTIFGEHARRRVVVLPVAREDVRAAHLHLAGIPFEHVVLVGIDEPHLDTRQRWPDRPDPRLRRHCARRHDGRSLREAITLVHPHPEPLSHPRRDRVVERGRAGDAQPDVRERFGGDVVRQRATTRRTRPEPRRRP